MMKKIRKPYKLLLITALILSFLISLGFVYAKYAYSFSHTIGEELGITLNGHDIKDTVYNPTCYEDGYTVYECEHEGCDYTYTVKDEGSAGHVWSPYQAANNFTYQGQVKYYVVYRECYRCGELELMETASKEEMEDLLEDLLNETIIEHTYYITDESKATCTSPGYIYYTCSCTDSTQHSFTEEIEALGHDYSNVDVIDPTCTTAGYTLHQCTRCDSSYRTDSTNALGHTLTGVGGSKAPTCTENGYTEAQYCTRCDELIYASEKINALGHDYVHTTWKISEGADRENVHEGICPRSGCGALLYQKHAFVEVYKIAPTCVENGYSFKVCAWVDENGSFVRVYSHKVGDTSGYVMYDAEGNPVCDENGEIIWCDGVEVKGNDGKTVTVDGKPLIVRIDTKNGTCGFQRIDTVAPLGHDMEGATDIVVKDPTCVDEGTCEYTCMRCNEYVTEMIPAKGHTYGDGVVALEPTCTETGTMRYTCTECGHIHDEDIPANGHSSIGAEYIITPATCTEDGRIEYECSVCKETVLDSTIDAVGHVFTETDTATCQSAGKLIKECDTCGFTEESESDIKDHNLLLQSKTVEPTCTTPGVGEIFYCTYGCGYTEGGETIPMIGHKPVLTTVDKTCSDSGYSVYACDICGVELSERFDFVAADPALHDYRPVSGTNTATCLLPGEEIQRCRHCGDEKVVETNALGHDMKGEDIVNDATCTEAGEKYRYCTRCGEKDYTVVTIPAKGHKWGVLEETKSATCTEDGEKSSVCSVCFEEETEDIPALGHDYVVKAEATCLVKGYEVCRRCGDSNIIPEQPCAFGAWITVSDATGCQKACEQGLAKAGLEERICKWCKTTEQRATYRPCTYDEIGRVEATDCLNPGQIEKMCRYCGGTVTTPITAAHDWGAYQLKTEATCAKGSVYERVCRVCGKTETRTNSDMTGDHKWGDDFKIILEPDCENGIPGKKEYTCEVCGKKKTELIPVGENGHQWIEGEKVPPTCLEGGYINCSCSVCGETKKEPTGEAALGHNWDAGVTTPPVFDSQKDGFTVYTCQRCGVTETVIIPYAHEHENDYEYGSVEACLNGIHCTTCGELVQPEGHAFGEGVVTEATCTHEGYTSYTCEKCGTVHKDDIKPVTDHNKRLVGGHQPEFDENGDLKTVGVLVYNCDHCGYYEMKYIYEYSDVLQRVLESFVTNSHEYYVYAGKTPTCTEDGSYHIYCMYHGVSVEYDHSTGKFTETFEVIIKGDTPQQFVVEVDLSSEQLDFTSLNKYGIGELSDTMTESYGVLPMLNGHYADADNSSDAALEAGTAEWRITVPATCDTEGVHALICKICDYEYETEVIPAGHVSPQHNEHIEATCVKNGVKEHWSCPHCGKLFLKNASGELYEVTYADIYLYPINHDYLETKVLPTCIEQGYTKHTCINCGASYQTDFVDANGHSFIYEWVWGEEYRNADLTVTCKNCDINAVRAGKVNCDITKAPTCTEPGLADYSAATVFMGESIVSETVKDVVLPATGHKYIGSWSWADGYGSAVLTLVCETDATHNRVENGTVTKNVKPVSCTEDGVTTYTATLTVDGVTYKDTVKITDAKATGHSFAEPVWTWNKDHTVATAAFKCANCGETREVKATGQKITSEMTLEPTYSENGTLLYTAKVTFMDKEYIGTAEEVIPRLGYSYEGDWTWKSDYSEAILTLTSDSDEKLNGTTYTVVPEKVTVDATCEESGKTVYTVTYTVTDPNGEKHTFKATEEVIIEPVGHEYTDVEPTWSYDTENMVATATFKCVNCLHTEKMYAKVTASETTAPGCVSTGVITYTAESVSFNGKTYTADPKTEAIPALGHSFIEPEKDQWIWADDNESATLTLKCDRCGGEYDFTDSKTDSVTTATCTEAGQTTYTAGVIVGTKSYTDSKTVETAALGHDYGEVWTWNTDRTSADVVLTCGRNGCTETREATTTNITSSVFIAAECEKEGYRRYVATVTVDGTVYTDYIYDRIAPLGHNYTVRWQWWNVSGTNPSATAYFKCSRCNTETPKNANVSYIETQKPTCTVAGSGTYTATVTFGGQTYTDQYVKSVPATGHSYSEPTSADWTWVSDYSSASVKLTCGVCDNSATYTDSVIDYVNTADCENEGTGTYTASVTANGKTYSDTKTVSTDALGHDYSDTWAWSDDRTSATLTLTCKRAGCTESVTVTDVTVAPDSTKTDVDPTCDTAGQKHYVATAVYGGKTYTGCESKSVDALDHDYTDVTPTWTWNGYTSAKANFDCIRCDHVEPVTASVEHVPENTADCNNAGTTVHTARVTFIKKPYTDTKTETVSAYCTYYPGEYAWNGREGDGITLTWSADHTSATYKAVCTGCECCDPCTCTEKNGTVDSSKIYGPFNAFWDGENFSINADTCNGTLYIVEIVINGKSYTVVDFTPYADESGYLTDGTLLYEFDEESKTYTVVGFSNTASSRTGALIPAYATHDESGWVTHYDSANGEMTAEYSPVTAISAGAFKDESAMTGIYIPKTVQYIGADAFLNCTDLNNLIVDDLVSWNNVEIAPSADGEMAIMGIPSHPLASYAPSDTSSTSTEDQFTHLYTFNDEGGLFEVTDADLTGIKELKYALAFCSNLKSVYIPSSLTKIHDMAFVNDTSLHKLYVDNLCDWNNVEIETDSAAAFLMLIYSIEGGIPGLSDLEMTSHPFTWLLLDQMFNVNSGSTPGTPRLYILDEDATVVEGSDQVVELHSTVFSEVIHADLDGIEELNHALYMCMNVKSITVTDTLKVINDGAFFYTMNLTELRFKDADHINSWAGVDISNDTFATMLIYMLSEGAVDMDVPAIPLFWGTFDNPDNPPVVSVWDEASEAYVAVNSITVNAEIIKPYVFASCSGIDTVYIGENVKYIGSYAFAGCFGSLTSESEATKGIVLPEGSFTWGLAATLNDAMSGNTVDILDLSAISSRDLALQYNSGDVLEYWLVKVETAVVDDFIFGDINGETYLVDYQGDASLLEDGKLILPSDYNGKPYKIGANVFNADKDSKYASHILSVVVPYGVTEIGENAFAGCTALTSLTVGKDVAHIADGAFAECWSLCNLYVESLPIWNEVTFDTDSYFSNTIMPAETGTSVDFPSHPFVYYVANNMDRIGTEGYGTNLYVMNAETGEYDLVTDADLSGITELKYAITLCTGITSVYIPEGLTHIGDGAFAFDVSLNTVKVHDLVSWNDVTMEKDSALAALMALDGISGLATPSHPLLWHTFMNYRNEGFATHLYIDGIADEIKHADLSGITDLKYAITLCTNIESVYIPSTLTHITDGAFLFDKSLATMYLDDVDAWAGVTIEMDSFAKIFSGGEDLPSHPFTWYEMMAEFMGETKVYLASDGENELTKVIFSDSATVINDYAFFCCTGIDTVVVGNNIGYIGANAFTGCFAKLTETDTEKGIYLTDPELWYYAESREDALAGNGYPVDLTGIDTPVALGLAYRNNISNIAGIYLFKVNDATEAESPFKFIEYNGKYYLTGYNGTDTDLILPADYNGNSYEIYRNAFMGNTSITSVVIPAGVTAIGDYAFDGCTNLKTVTVGENVSYIGINAFRGCFGTLTGTDTDKGVIFVAGDNSGSYVWYYNTECENAVLNGTVIDMSGLNSLQIAQAYINQSIYSKYLIRTETFTVNGYTFCQSDNECWLMSYPEGVANLVLPDIGRPYGIYPRNIDGEEQNTTIKTVVIPDGVTYIGEGAFAYCTSLTDVTIPDSVTQIGEGAFAFCISLRKAVLPSGLTKIPMGMFMYCISLEEVTIPDGVTSIEDAAFGLCMNLKAVEIPSGVTYIGSAAFAQCSSLKSITIPSGVKEIKDSTFTGCSALRTVFIPSGVTAIGSSAFEGCISLKSIEIPSSVRTLGNYAFQDCSSLTSISLPYYLTEIGNYAFNNCSSLTSVTIPYNVTSIGQYAFYGCNNLTNVYFNYQSGWYVTSSSTATSGTSVDLTNSATNATYLKSTYYSNYWKR